MSAPRLYDRFDRPIPPRTIGFQPLKKEKQTPKEEGKRFND